MNTTLKSILAFSIAASLIFSNAATINAGSKKDWAHSHAYGQTKHDKHQSKHNVKHYSHKSNQKHEKVHKDHKQEDKKPIFKHQTPTPTPKKVVNHKQQDMHCANHNAPNVVKVTSSKKVVVDGQTVNVSIKGTKVFFKDHNGAPIEASFCIKASTNNSGVLTGTKGEVNFLNKGQKCPDISYVAIYSVVKPTVVKPSPVATPTTQPTITPTPKEQGQTLSTNTKKTGILGTNIERTVGNELPNTGGNTAVAAQALGLTFIVLGAVIVHVRKIQAKIAKQMSV